MTDIEYPSVDERIEKPTGFYLDEWSDKGLISALEKAIDSFHTPNWTSYVDNCMKLNSSWEQRVGEYILIYRQLMEKDIEKQENQ